MTAEKVKAALEVPTAAGYTP